MQPWANLVDHQLITQTLEGDHDAYGEIVRRYQTTVYNVAYRLVGEQQEALDVVQEAFVRAYNTLGSFDQARPFGPWINRIATNIALTLLQRQRHRSVPLIDQGITEDLIETNIFSDYSTEPEHIFLASEQQLVLRRAIAALPTHFRVIIELRHFQDRSYEEIAELLDVPLSTVKSHLFRARRLLRTLLEEQ